MTKEDWRKLSYRERWRRTREDPEWAASPNAVRRVRRFARVWDFFVICAQIIGVILVTYLVLFHTDLPARFISWLSK
jgi:hypothetical protein